MDGRFLALGDPDFFDVPWARADAGPPLEVPSAWLAGWDQHTAGLWRSAAPAGARVPDAGWKIHVGARPDQAQAAVVAVARVCRDEGAAWKCLRSVDLAWAAQDKYAPSTLTGKVCVVYPAESSAAARIIERLAVELVDVSGPRVLGDRHHASAPLGVRWGAFTEDWIERDGGLLPAVRVGGELVHDDRHRPARRALPAELAAALGTPPATVLPVREARLVQRNSTGAIYRAVLDDGRTVALKEARAHTGVDASGADAVDRLRHEYAVLRRVAGRGIAPEPYDLWEAEDSIVLVSGWLDGETLAGRVSRRAPRSRPDITSDAEYAAWSLRTRDALASLVDRIHELGVAHGDLSPSNVLCAEAGLRLVDFECASLDGVAVTDAVTTPGFHLDDLDARVRDRFALARTQAYLDSPDVLLIDRRPDLTPHFELAERARPAAGRTRSDVPDSTAAFATRLETDLLSRATPERADRLFPGGSGQFTNPLGGHDVLSGAAGVLLALQARGHPPVPAHLDWLAAVSPGPASGHHGLGVGVEGIALALALLGRGEQAIALLGQGSTAMPESLSWARGRSGCGLALLELGRLLGDRELTARGLDLLDGVIESVEDERVTLHEAGLLDGWSGVALALLGAARLIDDDRLTVAARSALRRAYRDMWPAGDRLVVTSAGRVHAGLGQGSAAFVLGVAALGRSDPELTEAARAAARGCASVVAPVAGLMDGLTGTVAALRAHGYDAGSVAALEQRTTWHCVETDRGWSTWGERRLRCSDDVRTGTAGLLTVLGDGDLRGLAYVLRVPVGPSACS